MSNLQLHEAAKNIALPANGFDVVPPADPMVLDISYLEEPRTPSRFRFQGFRFQVCAIHLQKLAAEIISTFILVFTGCGSAMVDNKYNNSITHLGVSISFGLVVMIMVYTVGHISGAHMNPAVTLGFAAAKHFSWKQVPGYIGAQLIGSMFAAFVLKLIVGPVAHLGATIPVGSDVQSFFLELVITFILMFVIASVATDTRAVGELAGLAIGATVCLNAILAGPISGASMNPARSLGPAIVSNDYHGIWVYIAGPILGALLGAFAYTIIRLPVKPSDCEPRSKSFKR